MIEEGNESNGVMLGTHPEGILPGPNTRIAQAADDSQEDWGIAEDTLCSCYKANTVFGQALFDAGSVYNRSNHYIMLWNAVHLWDKESNFTYNLYCECNLT